MTLVLQARKASQTTFRNVAPLSSLNLQTITGNLTAQEARALALVVKDQFERYGSIDYDFRVWDTVAMEVVTMDDMTRLDIIAKGLDRALEASGNG